MLGDKTELPTVGERCETCRYWEFSEMSETEPAARVGDCRRHPPRVQPKKGMETSEWPKTWGDLHWCGEWRAKAPAGPAPLDAYRREVLELLGREKANADLLAELMARLDRMAGQHGPTAFDPSE